jgi:hypothetical protein
MTRMFLLYCALVSLWLASLGWADMVSIWAKAVDPHHRLQRGPDIQAWRDISYMSRAWHARHGGNPEFYPGEEVPR